MPRKLLKSLWMILLMVLVFQACQNRPGEHLPENDAETYEDQLIDANKKAISTERRQIIDFVKRHQWKLKETGTGLLYSIYEKGEGQVAAEGDRAVLDYSVSLISGTEIYSSEDLGPLQFTIGRGGVPSGLEEGILLMREGDRAKFIIPSHLAYGLLGDQDKIPPKATLIYDVKLLELK